jgi:hypothetical protein
LTATIRPLRTPAESRAIPLPIPPAEKALRAAARAGYADGERVGYVSGWRYGVVCGLIAGVPLGMVSCWAAIELGRLLA